MLRHDGMTEIGLHAVFWAVVFSRLTYASPAWSRFISEMDGQCVDAHLSRSRRRGFCPPDMPDFDQLLEEQMIDCLREYWTVHITHCTSYFDHNLQHHRNITSDTAPMIDNCMNTKDTWMVGRFLVWYRQDLVGPLEVRGTTQSICNMTTYTSCNQPRHYRYSHATREITVLYLPPTEVAFSPANYTRFREARLSWSSWLGYRPRWYRAYPPKDGHPSQYTLNRVNMWPVTLTLH